MYLISIFRYLYIYARRKYECRDFRSVLGLNNSVDIRKSMKE
jgi:hypothetical protein